MTVVVGYIESNKTYLACDSYIEWGWMRGSIDSKIHTIQDKVLIGVSGNMGILGVIKHMNIEPNLSNYEEWMQTGFVPQLRQHLSEQGFLKVEGGMQTMDGSMLIGGSGRLFALSSDFSLIRIRGTYHAIGTGAHAAMGALYVMQKSKGDPQRRLRVALEAASQIAVSVAAPFHIYEVQKC